MRKLSRQPVFKVIVDYSRTQAKMIKAGKYDWVGNEITDKYFPPASGQRDGKVSAKLELLHFDKVMSSEAVLAEMKHRGYRPAILPELLAFGETYPEEQRRYPVVALGSVWGHWDGYRHVACLCECDGGRDLGLLYRDGGWGGSFRFLAVRES